MMTILLILLICCVLFLVYLGIVSLLSSLEIIQLKHQVKTEREALQKELRDLDREAYQAFNQILKESMDVAKENYQEQRQNYTNPVTTDRKDVEPI